MKKIVVIIFIWFFIALFANCLVLGRADEFDDLKRSFKDLERPTEQDSIKGVELKKEDQLISINLQKSDQFKGLESQKDYQLPLQKIRPFAQDMTLGNKPATDEAILKNQQLFKKMMDEKKGVPAGLEAWGLKIPAKHRLIIELIFLAIFVSYFGFKFYKRKIHHVEEQKAPVEEQESHDGITFYTPKASEEEDIHED